MGREEFLSQKRDWEYVISMDSMVKSRGTQPIQTPDSAPTNWASRSLTTEASSLPWTASAPWWRVSQWGGGRVPPARRTAATLLSSARLASVTVWTGTDGSVRRRSPWTTWTRYNVWPLTK